MHFPICESNSPAVKALGPLFNLTEVQLWDDGSGVVLESPHLQEPTKLVIGDKDVGGSHYTGTDEFCSPPEDVELAEKLNELGLPLSFHSNKEKRPGGEKKECKRNFFQHNAVYVNKDCMLDSTKLSGEENIAPSPALNMSGPVKDGITMGVDSVPQPSLDEGDSMWSTSCTSTLSHGIYDIGEVSDIAFDHSLSSSCGVASNLLDDKNDLITCSEKVMAVNLSPGGGEISEGSYLGVGSCSMEIEGELEFVNVDTILLMDHKHEDQSNDASFEVTEDSDAASFGVFSTDFTMIENNQIAISGEWMACWDDIHMRTYFYNFKTQESTWDPPSAINHLASGKIPDEARGAVDMLAKMDNDQINVLRSNDVQTSFRIQNSNYYILSRQRLDETAENWRTADGLSTNTVKRKKKVRKTKQNRKLSMSLEGLNGALEDASPTIRKGVLEEVSPRICKYWHQRYLLFSKFDCGIKMDEEGWFSVTPQLLAKHHADRCGNGSVVDFFTGVGGNAIQFAQRCKHVIAIDIDPNKIEYARHNAAIYGVGDNVDFIQGNSFSLAPKLMADTVFMSPPWGGPTYSKVKTFDIYTMLKPHDGYDLCLSCLCFPPRQALFDVGKEIASKIVMFLPRNVDTDQLVEISLSSTPPWSLEVEKNFLNGRLKAVTAYFSLPSLSQH